jgi:hypothetical protein
MTSEDSVVDVTHGHGTDTVSTTVG